MAACSKASQLNAEYEGGAKAAEGKPNKHNLEILGVENFAG